MLFHALTSDFVYHLIDPHVDGDWVAGVTDKIRNGVPLKLDDRECLFEYIKTLRGAIVYENRSYHSQRR